MNEMPCKWCFKFRKEHQLEYNWTPKYYCAPDISYQLYTPMDNLTFIEYVAKERNL
jgi:hypothetical protein